MVAYKFSCFCLYATSVADWGLFVRGGVCDCPGGLPQINQAPGEIHLCEPTDFQEIDESVFKPLAELATRYGVSIKRGGAEVETINFMASADRHSVTVRGHEDSRPPSVQDIMKAIKPFTNHISEPECTPWLPRTVTINYRDDIVPEGYKQSGSCGEVSDWHLESRHVHKLVMAWDKLPPETVVGTLDTGDEELFYTTYDDEINTRAQEQVRELIEKKRLRVLPPYEDWRMVGTDSGGSLWLHQPTHNSGPATRRRLVIVGESWVKEDEDPNRD